MPQQRALNKEEKAKAAKLLEMKANKKLVQQQLSQETGNIVLLKDLSNISTANKQRKSRNNLDMTVATLLDKYGMLCSICNPYNWGLEWFLFALLQYIREHHIHVVLVVGVLEQACTGKVLVGPRLICY